MSIMSLAILGGVIAMITVRQVGRVRLQIWQAMTIGAAAMLLTGSIAPTAALRAIDLDVILFLFNMFALGRALEASGLLTDLTFRAVRRCGSDSALLTVFVIVVGVAGAVLMNDTLAVVGVPVVVRLARSHGLPPRLLLLALAFAVTTGSVASPIGNPQNLLIALHGNLDSGAFARFLVVLGLPTAIALALVIDVLRVAFRRDFHGRALLHQSGEIETARSPASPAWRSWCSSC